MARSRHVDDLLICTNAKRWFRRPRGVSPSELLPGFFAQDPIVLTTLEKQTVALNELKPDVNDDGTVGKTGIPSDFNKLLNVSQYGMDPLPIPLLDNKILREELGLEHGFRDRDLPLFDALVGIMFKYHSPASVPIRRSASTGFPFFTADIDYKLPALRKALGNITDYLNASTTDPARALAEYDSQWLYAIHERQSADTIKWDGRGVPVSKERLVPDELYARSGGVDGIMYPADKRVFINGHLMTHHFAMRRRTVWGLSFVPNYTIAAVLACHRKVYAARFEFTWVHRTPASIAAKLSKFSHFVGSDVKSFDVTVPRWGIDRFLDQLTNYVREDFVEHLRLAFKAPFIMPYPFRDKRLKFNSLFGGDPFDLSSFSVNAGLPSGISINPDFGKFWMTFVYLVAFRDCGVPLSTTSEVESFLRGESELGGLLDLGDDAVLMAHDEELSRKLTSYQSTYSKLEQESPFQFLGNIAQRVADTIDVLPNPTTATSNQFAPEQGINSFQRKKFWELGALDRIANYSRHPAYREINDITERTWMRFAGVSPRTLTELSAMQKGLYQRVDLTDADRLVLQNPDYLYYRVNPDDVSQNVLAEIAAVIPATESYPMIKQLFKGQVYG